MAIKTAKLQLKHKNAYDGFASFIDQKYYLFILNCHNSKYHKSNCYFSNLIGRFSPRIQHILDLSVFL